VIIREGGEDDLILKKKGVRKEKSRRNGEQLLFTITYGGSLRMLVSRGRRMGLLMGRQKKGKNARKSNEAHKKT